MNKKEQEKSTEQLSKEDIIVLLKLRNLKDNTFNPMHENDPDSDYLVDVNESEFNKIAKERIVRDREFKLKLSKANQKFLRRICTNPQLSYSDKLKLLSKDLKASKADILRWAELFNLKLYSSQFAIAKTHKLANKKRYIISSAQNASKININFLENLKAYAEFIDAEIGIIATRYRNPTSTWKEDYDIWAEELQDYLLSNRQIIHPDLIVLGDLKIQATAPNPTNGIELFGDGKSCIVGSPRIELRSIPILPDQKNKFLYSTGTVTKPNFTDTVAGGKAAEHHSYGFVIVEIESDDVVHVRNVSAHKDGSFNDLKHRVQNQKVTYEEVETMVWGDSHFAQKDDQITNAFRSICKTLGIKISILHDIWDSESINVHNIKDPIVQHKLMVEGRDDLKKELKQMNKELKWFDDNMDETYVIASNHDNMLDRAMTKGDWRDNLKNARIFVDLLALTLSGKANKGVIPYVINKRFKNITALGLDDSLVHRDIELALHGHKGSNGSRGSINHFSKLSIKTIIGHSHTPGIRWGCYQVGVTCKLDHDYNKGLSSWAYASCLLNKYGKRQMIILNKDTKTYTTFY